VHRADRGYITLFINGRWIQDLRLTYAIIQAYHTLLPVKRFPVAFVMVTMPLEEIDVNVHPAKTEVRFRDPDLIFRTVQRAVRASIITDAPVAASWQPASVPSSRLLPEEDAKPQLRCSPSRQSKTGAAVPSSGTVCRKRTSNISGSCR
jgi:DNA mismatch repair protein MutL